jgi:hypothetical protein
LKIADHVFGAERFDFQLAAGFFFDRIGPRLEGFKADAAGPGCLNTPGGGGALGGADKRRAKLVGRGQHAGQAAGRRRRALQERAPGVGF